MSARSFDAAAAYAAAGRPVFPCRWQAGPTRKAPLTPRGFKDASLDPAIIAAWGRQWPDALVGMPTGAASGLVVFDIDVKDARANGFDSLDDLGIMLPDTPMAHTTSGGLHVYFRQPEHELRCSVGLIGPGLDVRAEGGYVILPSPGSGYEWDPLLNFGTCAPLAAPPWLWPVRPSRPALPPPTAQTAGALSRYAEAAIELACDAIARAGAGQQERTLNAECFSIGTLAGAGLIPDAIAVRALLRAAGAMPDYDPRWPWRPEEIDQKVRRAFDAGQLRPREARRAVA